jgi:hypothetical protein
MVFRIALKFGNSEVFSAIISYLRGTLYLLQVCEKLKMLVNWIISLKAKKCAEKADSIESNEASNNDESHDEDDSSNG